MPRSLNFKSRGKATSQLVVPTAYQGLGRPEMNVGQAQDLPTCDMPATQVCCQGACGRWHLQKTLPKEKLSACPWQQNQRRPSLTAVRPGTLCCLP